MVGAAKASPNYIDINKPSKFVTHSPAHSWTVIVNFKSSFSTSSNSLKLCMLQTLVSLFLSPIQYTACFEIADFQTSYKVANRCPWSCMSYRVQCNISSCVCPSIAYVLPLYSYSYVVTSDF